MLPETQGPEKNTTAVKTVPLAPPFLVVSSLQLIDPSWISAGTGAREMQGSTPTPTPAVLIEQRQGKECPGTKALL